jgi:hypothetical protein
MELIRLEMCYNSKYIKPYCYSKQEKEKYAINYYCFNNTS